MRALLVVLLCSPAALAAQMKAVPLKPADMVLKDSIEQTWTVREMSDGRVMVPRRGGPSFYDRKGNALGAIDGAPYGFLYSLPADTTLVRVFAVGWAFLANDKVLGMLPETNPVVALDPEIHGLDRSGHVLMVTGGSGVDSAKVLLVSRTSGAQQLITRVWQSPPARGGQPAPTYVIHETPVLAPDGWIAVVRAHPYRVDWRAPDGTWTLGAPLAVPKLKMDQREQLATFHPYEKMYDPSIDYHWPEWVEPITYPSPVITPDGKVLVLRKLSADELNVTYDLINRRGELEQRFVLPGGAFDRIVGIGSKSVYIWTHDSVARTPNGVIERHPWP